MTATQALLLKTYDSETDGRARFMGHSAFEHPSTPKTHVQGKASKFVLWPSFDPD